MLIRLRWYGRPITIVSGPKFCICCHLHFYFVMRCSMDLGELAVLVDYLLCPLCEPGTMTRSTKRRCKKVSKNQSS